MDSLIVSFQELVLHNGSTGVFGYIFGIALTAFIPVIPSTPIAILGGTLFGAPLGILYTITGLVLGSCLAFFIGRIFGIPLLKKILSPETIIETEEKLKRFPLPLAVFFLRVVPFTSFDAVSYAAGLTPIKFSHFFVATVSGLVPFVTLYSFFGEVIGVETEILIGALALFALAPVLLVYLFERKQHKK